MDTPAGRRYLAFDQVGSLRAVTDTSGVVVGTMSCDSFGNVVSASGEATAVGLGFAGGFTDADTHLVLFGARDYDASQGRWMAKDPIGFEGGDVDLYGYCLGDPVGLVDPAGLRSEQFGGGGASADCETTSPCGGFSRPDPYDWGLLVSGSFTEMFSAAMIAGALFEPAAAPAAVKLSMASQQVSSMTDWAGLAYTWYEFNEGRRLPGDLALAAACFSPGVSTWILGMHVAASATGADIYAR